MNTPISFEISRLLKEKGFDIPTLQWYHRDTKKLNTNNLMFSMNKLTDNYSAPTIADVVMWLFEKHGIWVLVSNCNHNGVSGWCFDIHEIPSGVLWMWKRGDMIFNSPKEAYEAGIKLTLKNLIK